MSEELRTATVQIEYHFACPYCLHHHTDDEPESPFECEECGREFHLESTD